MKRILINLLGELPYLLVLEACYIIIDRCVFDNRLTPLIREGWARRLRRLSGRLRRGGKLLPLQPANPDKILDTVDYDMGLLGQSREATSVLENNRGDNDSFTPGEPEKTSSTGGRSAVVSAEDQDRVFSDSREIIAAQAEDVEFEGDDDTPPPPEELTTEETYSDDGYFEDEASDPGYNELEMALNLATGKEMTPDETELARRAIMHLQGTPEYSELEERNEHIKQKIKTVVAEVFGEAITGSENHPANGFDMGRFM